MNDEEGRFLKNECCTECDWYAKPIMPLFILSYHGICPNCGSETEGVVGRFKIKTIKRWFATETYVTGFIKI